MRNTRRASIATLAAAALVAGPATGAHAQFDFGGGFDDTPPWEQFTLNPKARVRMDFRNASIDAVLRMLSQASGVTIVKDPALTGGLTLQSPKEQSLADAFSMLNAVLKLKNYNLVKEGSFLVIRQVQQGGGRFGGRGGFNPEQFGGGRGRDDSPQLRVYAIKYANAAQVARVINEVFALPPTAQQNAAASQPGQQPGAAQPQPGGGGGGGRGGGGGGGRFGGGGRGGRGGFGLSVSGSAVKASSDDFSNSVIVNAPGRDHEQIGRLIEQIDKQTEEPQKSRVFPLQYASAAELAPVVQNVLVSNAPRGRGGIGTQNVPIEQRFQQAARFGSAQAAFGTVIADARTNSLVVTGTEENLVTVAKVIDELDKEVSFENSTFVFTLQNARADAVSQLLNQSFGTRAGGGGNFGGTGFGRAGGVNTNRGRVGGGNPQRTTPGGGGGGLGGRSVEQPEDGADGETVSSADVKDMPLELAQPGAESGDLATRVTIQDGFQVALAGAAQFGGGGQRRGGFGGGGGQRPQAGSPSGLNAQGQVVNVRDLTGQVTAVPDINTNSVIIVTSPENRAIVEQILNQLDRIPEQVVIETLIVEASLDASKKLGVEWNLTQQGNAFGIPKLGGTGTTGFGLQGTTTQPQGLRYTLTGTQFSAFLQAVQTDSRFDVLSTPRIFTSNNANAQINISQSLPYVLNQRFDNNGNPIFNYAFLDVGIVLNVTPRITSNGYVTMDVTQTANDFVRYTEFNAPIVNQREAQTTVSVRDGETVVLGGIIRNSVQTTVNKVPLLGDIPLLGKLFRSRQDTNAKTELLVFLTPRIVRDAEEARRIREKTELELDPRTKARIDAVRPLTTAPLSPPKPAPGSPAPAPPAAPAPTTPPASGTP